MKPSSYTDSSWSHCICFIEAFRAFIPAPVCPFLDSVMGPNLHRILLYLRRKKNGSSAIKENCVGREHLESSEIWWSYCQIKLPVLSCNGKLNGGQLQFLPVLRGYLLGDFYEANTEDNIKGNLLKKIIISLLRSTKNQCQPQKSLWLTVTTSFLSFKHQKFESTEGKKKHHKPLMFTQWQERLSSILSGSPVNCYAQGLTNFLD